MSFQNMSIVIATRNRCSILKSALESILRQDCGGGELLVVDDSNTLDTKLLMDDFRPLLLDKQFKVAYIQGKRLGLTSARNLGIRKTNRRLVLFIDDDVVLERKVLRKVEEYMLNNPTVLGLQVNVLTKMASEPSFLEILENAVKNAFLLYSTRNDKSKVRRSGRSILPRNLTRTIGTTVLSGCFMCYRREVFSQQKFDENLPLFGPMEDMEFSYRLHLRHPGCLRSISSARVLHMITGEARGHNVQRMHLWNIGWYYVFRKLVYNGSFLNLVCYLYAVTGDVLWSLARSIICKTPLAFISCLASHIIVLRNSRYLLKFPRVYFQRTISSPTMSLLEKLMTIEITESK